MRSIGTVIFKGNKNGPVGTGFCGKRTIMQIRFFAPNNPNPVETIQADVIPPVGSLIRFPNGVIWVATQVRLDLPGQGLALQVVDVMVQPQ
jgi:hypothetical protein